MNTFVNFFIGNIYIYLKQLCNIHIKKGKHTHLFDVGWFWLCCTVDKTFLKHPMGYECVALITAFKIILKGYIFVKNTRR